MNNASVNQFRHTPSRQAIVLQYLIDHPGAHTAVSVSDATNLKRTTVGSILGLFARLGYAKNDMGHYSATVKEVPPKIDSEIGRASPVRTGRRAQKRSSSETTADPGVLLVIELGDEETIDLNFDQARAIWRKLNTIFGSKP